MNDLNNSSGSTPAGSAEGFGKHGGFSTGNLHDSVAGITTIKHHLNGEVLPHMDNYHSQHTTGGLRPTLDELYMGEKSSCEKEMGDNDTTGGIKFGWIQGVLIRCLLNIWGVMLFLRLSWVVAQAGIGEAILIVLLATAVTILTALSMSAISTNGQIKGGGTYYMISRSLGPEFGAAIGIIFALANALAVAMHTVGFCESLNDLLEVMGVKIIDNGPNDIRIIGSITIVVLGVIVGIGMEWEAKAQLLFMGILIVALANFIIGSIIGPTSNEELGSGFIGYDVEIITANLYSDYRVFAGVDYQFFSVFAIFFPAATGILAGANISGDLKNPSSAIPKGTILAIIITSFSYILFAIIAGATVLRDATGNSDDYVNGTVAEFMKLCSGRYNECEWGLHNSYQVMTLVSAFGPLNYAGCFAATLSSALACFVSAPKVFQALCRDRLFPYIHVFEKGYGKNQEPLRAYALTFVIAFGFIMIAELNVIAPLITNFYLASYTLVNFSTFHVDLIRPIGWRPTFKYFNKWLSLVGCCLSFAAMFLCSWPYALATTAAVSVLFLVVKKSKPQVNWGSSGQAQTYKTALITIHRLNANEEHVKTYTPQVLVMTGSPNARPSLVDFSYLICKNHSLMVCGEVVENQLSYQQRSEKIMKATHWLRAHKTKSFYTLVDDMTFSNGVRAMLQAAGIGRMRPNILLLGYQSDWTTETVKRIDEYFTAIHMALGMHVAVAILRVQEGLDYTGIVGDCDGDLLHKNDLKNTEAYENPAFVDDKDSIVTTRWSTANAAICDPITERTKEDGDTKFTKNSEKNIANEENAKKTLLEKLSSNCYRDSQGNLLSPDVLEKICRFKLPQKKGTIDVWWLYDDGGLSMLLPHILTTRSNWANSRLRVFCLADDDEAHHTKQKNMKLLLNKFRIPVTDVIVIPDITGPPSDETRRWFDDLTRDLLQPDDRSERSNTSKPTIQHSELEAHKQKSLNYMRLRELILEFSKDANLIALTMPLPRKGSISGPLYMAWLETLTADMPPFLIVRGNQRSVLTFYS